MNKKRNLDSLNTDKKVPEGRRKRHKSSTEDREITQKINNSTYPCVSEQSRGKKQYQQDRVLCTSEFPELKGEWSLYCVFDGHGGHTTSEWLLQNFKARLVSSLLKEVDENEKAPKKRLPQIKKAILVAIQNAEKELMDLKGLTDGSTAVICLLDGETQTVTTANLGDSRAVLARVPKNKKSSKIKAIQLSQDHTAGTPSEMKRIQAAGHLVMDGRVHLKKEVKEIEVKTGDFLATYNVIENRSLEVSRSFGDRDYKNAGVIAVPYMSKFKIVPGRDKFLLLACDGLFEEWKNGEVVNFVYEKLFDDPTKPTLQESLRSLMRETILFRNAKDNTSVVLVLLDKSSRKSGFW